MWPLTLGGMPVAALQHGLVGSWQSRISCPCTPSKEPHPAAHAAPCHAAGDPNTTFKIRMISHEALHDQSVSEKVAHWKAVFREKGGWWWGGGL